VSRAARFHLHVNARQLTLKFTLALNDQPLDAWTADGGSPTPTKKPDAHASTRHTVRAVPLRPGDRIRLNGAADGEERAAVDYLEIIPLEQEQTPPGKGR
jgi:hypothetical protein